MPEEQEEQAAQEGAAKAEDSPPAAERRFAWALAPGKEPTTLASLRQAIAASITTPVAQPAPPPRPLVSRRLFVLGGFWSALGLAAFAVLASPLDFLFPRNVKGFGGPITVPAGKIPTPGGDPVRPSPEGKFWLLNLEPGITPHGEETPGGLLALWQKCPHLGCTVPWRPDFVFAGRKAWFRCPCHGSTYTKEGGVRVFGPAPRSMDVFPLEVKDDGSILVQTGPQFKGTGSVDNPSKAVPYSVLSGSELTAAALAEDTAIEVKDASSFQEGMTIAIDEEQLRIVAISDNRLSVERGVEGTKAQYHKPDTVVAKVSNRNV